MKKYEVTWEEMGPVCWNTYCAVMTGDEVASFERSARHDYGIVIISIEEAKV